MSQVLNPPLHAKLVELFDEVRMSKPGEALRYDASPQWAIRRGRAVPRGHPRVAGWGETYMVCCPFCGDGRFRLAVSHAWGTAAPHGGPGRYWLAKCFNETDCLSDPVNRYRLQKMLLPAGSPLMSVAAPAAPTRPGRSDGRAPGLPPGLTPVHLLPPGDPARLYLLERGFDPDALGRGLGVGYCPYAEPPYGFATGRIVVPVAMDGRVVGIQARRLDDGGGRPKWFSTPGMRKSELLYNYDVARTYSVAVVCEGVTDVWRVGPCGVALFGVDMSAAQLGLLARGWAGGTVVLLLDNDGPQKPGAQEASRRHEARLRPLIGGRVVRVTLPDGTDPGELSRAGVWSFIREAADRQGVRLPAEDLDRLIPYPAAADGPGDGRAGGEPATGLVAARLLRQCTGEVVADGPAAAVEGRLEAAGLGDLYRAVELPAALAAADMRRNGVRLDVPWLEELDFELGRRMRLLAEELNHVAGRAVNPNSDADVEAALRRTPGEGGTTRAWGGTSPAVGARNTLPALAKDFQQLQRTSAGVSRLLNRVDRRTGRVHCVLDPLGTATGRFSCADPPLHSLPGELRDVVVAAPGCLLVQADFSQIELRVLAHYSRDPGLVGAFRDGSDLHRRTAAAALGVPEAGVSPEDRNRVGKAVNFGIVYGMTAHSLAERLGVGVPQAEAFLSGFFDRYPGVRRWIDETERSAARDRAVTTLYGRRRALPQAAADDPGECRRGLRQAVNTVIQGTAADINKLALARLQRALDPECRMVLTVHDSVLVEVPCGRAAELAAGIGRVMEESPPRFDVPLKVAVGVGATWGECERAAKGG